MPFPAFFLLAAALGGREAIINRRNRNQLLDDEAERQDSINAIDIGLSAATTGTNRFDAAQIKVMQTQTQTAIGMLRSKDPKLQSIGANMLQDLDSAVRGNIQQNETEFRADEVRAQDEEIAAAGLGLAANEARFERELVMNKQLNDELKGFGTAKLAFDKVNNLLDNDDQLASLAGITAFVQSIDDSVVREAELLKYQGANGFITQLVNIVNKSEGRDFDPATKQSIRNASAALLNSEKTRATAITNSYQDRAVGFGLNADRVMSGVDENLFTPIQIDKTAQLAAQAQADTVEQAFAADPDQFVEQTGELIGFDIPGTDKRLTINPAANITSRLVEPFLSMTAAIGRTLRGAKLLRKNDGSLWIQEADGSMSRVTNQDFSDLKNQVQHEAVQLPPDLQRRVDNGELEAREL